MKRLFIHTAIFSSLVFCIAARKPQQSIENLETSVSNLKKQKATATPAQQDEIQRQITGQLDQMERIGDQKRDDPKAQVDMGERFLRVDEPERALNRGNLAANLAPNDPAPRVVQAESYYKLHRYEDAVGAAKEALRLDPQNKPAQAVLMLAHGQTARNPAADMLKRQGDGASDDAAKPAGVRGNAGRGDGTGPRAAETANDEAAKLKVRESLAQAKGKLELGDHAAAVAALGKLIALRPKDARAYALRAKALLVAAGKGDATAAGRALADARQASALSPQSATGKLLVAQALEATGAPRQEIEAAYNAAAELDPAFDSYHQQALARWQSAAPAGEKKASAVSGPDANDGAAVGVRGVLRHDLPWLAAALAAACALLMWRAKSRLT